VENLQMKIADYRRKPDGGCQAASPATKNFTVKKSFL